ncbi:MAG: hypothetical protein JWO36_346 [Myxococcales bacterium]|nr:hypothetical protein [Myxococcales bacterium]
MRSETQAVEHAPREAKRIGECPPVSALREVGAHAHAMQPRLQQALEAYAVPVGRGGISATLNNLRHFVADHVQDAERAYRGALLDLRHGLEVVRVLREISRLEGLFGIIRWCDDWLSARRTLVARVEAQLGWFAEQELAKIAEAEQDADSPAFLDWL